MTQDLDLEVQVANALEQEPALASKIDVGVDVKNGAVTLDGSVHDENERTAAEKVATAVSGVTRVTNNLQVAKA